MNITIKKKKKRQRRRELMMMMMLKKKTEEGRRFTWGLEGRIVCRGVWE